MRMIDAIKPSFRNSTGASSTVVQEITTLEMAPESVWRAPLSHPGRPAPGAGLSHPGGPAPGAGLLRPGDRVPAPGSRVPESDGRRHGWAPGDTFNAGRWLSMTPDTITKLQTAIIRATGAARRHWKRIGGASVHYD